MATTYANGKRPLSTMSVVRGEYFDPVAAAQLILLEADFKAIAGYEAIILEGYRTYARQVELELAWDAYQNGTGPYAELAARRGTSTHGFGLACDFGSGINEFGSANKILMDRLAPARGWWPTGNDFSPREAWHYDFKIGTATAGAGSAPIDNESEESDEMANSGFIYTKTVGGKTSTIYLIANTDSGCYHEYGNGPGNGVMPPAYNNGVAAAFRTPAFETITEGHAGVIKAACERVLARA